MKFFPSIVEDFNDLKKLENDATEFAKKNLTQVDFEEFVLNMEELKLNIKESTEKLQCMTDKFDSNSVKICEDMENFKLKLSQLVIAISTLTIKK